MIKITKLLFLFLLISYVYGLYKLNIKRCSEYDDYSINYLRYQYDYKHYPQFCNYNSNNFNIKNIEYLRYGLENYWYDCNYINDENNINLWENMWYDYGSCTDLNQYEYFNKTMILFYNVKKTNYNCYYYNYIEYCDYYYDDNLEEILNYNIIKLNKFINNNRQKIIK